MRAALPNQYGNECMYDDITQDMELKVILSFKHQQTCVNCDFLDTLAWCC